MEISQTTPGRTKNNVHFQRYPKIESTKSYYNLLLLKYGIRCLIK